MAGLIFVMALGEPDEARLRRMRKTLSEVERGSLREAHLHPSCLGAAPSRECEPRRPNGVAVLAI